MRIQSFTAIFFLIFIASSSFAGLIQPTAKITIKAIDSNGKPLADVDVVLQFHVSTGWGSSTNFLKGKTNGVGQFSGEGESIDYCNISVKKSGYYTSYDEYHFKNVTVLNRWEPWNPTIEVVLKEIKNPVPMNAKKTGFMKLPALNIPIGYDLEKGDWVAPYGKGLVNDFIFNFKTKYISRDEWDCSYKVSFSNGMDGIQEYISDKNDSSVYGWPYEAPEGGYKSELTLSDSYNINKKHESGFKENKYYIFRVRTKVDDNGNIINACYGKLKGDIELAADGFVRFVYYLNPSGSKNLEYDPKKSLFKWKTLDELDNNKIDRP